VWPVAARGFGFRGEPASGGRAPPAVLPAPALRPLRGGRAVARRESDPVAV